MNLTQSQIKILRFVWLYGPITDKGLQKKVANAGFSISDSGLRTRRSELVRMGLVDSMGTSRGGTRGERVWVVSKSGERHMRRAYAG